MGPGDLDSWEDCFWGGDGSRGCGEGEGIRGGGSPGSGSSSTVTFREYGLVAVPFIMRTFFLYFELTEVGDVLCEISSPELKLQFHM